MKKTEATKLINEMQEAAEKEMIEFAKNVARKAADVLAMVHEDEQDDVVRYFEMKADTMMQNGYDGEPEKMAITFAIANTLVEG